MSQPINDKQSWEISWGTFGFRFRNGCQLMDPMDRTTLVSKGMLSRILYANPVCLLTSNDHFLNTSNIMTITWLTTINNNGGLVCSMNKNRHSASFIRTGSVFVLNVPVAGMESLVLDIGGCSGRDINKFDQFDIPVCRPGWRSLSSCEGAGQAVHDNEGVDQSEKDRGCQASNDRFQEDVPHDQAAQETVTPNQRNHKNNEHKKKHKNKKSAAELWREEMRARADECIAVESCVAHVMVEVQQVQSTDGHWLITGQILAAWARGEYWDGKVFAPKHAGTPPFLTFFGSKQFGYVYASPLSSDACSAEGKDGATKDSIAVGMDDK